MTTPACSDTRTRLLAARRGLLTAAQTELVRRHLAECEACRSADLADAELSNVLGRLPRAPAPDALRRRLEAKWLPPRRRPKQRLLAIATGVTLALAIAAGALLWLRGAHSDAMVSEAINDHLRILYSEHPVEIASGGIHQVKPWFAGKVDFAPSVAFAGDTEFPLKGGSVAYFIDRKAAAFVFSRRLHTITLFVFPADGLPWPAAAGTALGSHRAFARSSRGFHVLMWRDGDLGYAAVSDVNERDLHELAARIEAAK